MIVQNVLLDPELLKKTGVFSLVLGYIAGGFFVGHWLDEKFHSTPLFTAVFGLAGLGYLVWRLWRQNESEKK